jgi:hypothetical protein
VACVRGLTWLLIPKKSSGARTVALDWTGPTFRFSGRHKSHCAVTKTNDMRG